MQHHLHQWKRFPGMVAFAAPNSCSPPEFSEPDQSNPAQVNNQHQIQNTGFVHLYKHTSVQVWISTEILATCQDFWSHHHNCNSNRNL